MCGLWFNNIRIYIRGSDNKLNESYESEFKQTDSGL